MQPNEDYENHEVYVDIVNDLIGDDSRYITGVSTTQHDIDEDINLIQIKVASRTQDDTGEGNDE